MTPRTHRSLLLAALLLAVTGCAFASNVAFVFTLNWQRGPLLGSTSQGTLSFDESLVAPNAQYLGTVDLGSFNLNVGSRSYGLADVTTGFLSFDANSDLRLLGVGTDCGVGSCEASQDPASFYIVYDSQSQLDRFYAVAGPPNSGQSYGVGNLLLAPVPEPSSLVILLSGMGLLALRRRSMPNPSIADVATVALAPPFAPLMSSLDPTNHAGFARTSNSSRQIMATSNDGALTPAQAKNF